MVTEEQDISYSQNGSDFDWSMTFRLSDAAAKRIENCVYSGYGKTNPHFLITLHDLRVLFL